MGENRIGMVQFTLPIRTYGEKNQHIHWSKKSKRTHNHRSLTAMVMRCNRSFSVAKSWVMTDSVLVTMTRIAPRELDKGDNCSSSMSAVRDSVADVINPGRGDRDPRIEWAYAQERGGVREYGVRVRIERRDMTSGTHRWADIKAGERSPERVQEIENAARSEPAALAGAIRNDTKADLSGFGEFNSSGLGPKLEVPAATKPRRRAIPDPDPFAKLGRAELPKVAAQKPIPDADKYEDAIRKLITLRVALFSSVELIKSGLLDEAIAKLEETIAATNSKPTKAR